MTIPLINRRLITLFCFLLFIVLGVSSGILGPTLPNIATVVALPLASGGLLRGARQIGSFGAFLIGGRLLDRYDPRVILLPGALAVALGLIGMGYTDNLAIVLAASLLLGIGSGFIDVGPNFIIGALYTTSASALLSALHTFFGLGGSGGPLVVQWARDQQGDWRAAYGLLAVAAVIIGALFIGTRLHPQQPQNTQEARQKATGRIRWLPLLPLIVLIFMYSGAGNGMSDWLYTHMELAARSTPETASQITSLYWLALTVGRIVSIFTLRQFGNIPMLKVGLFLSTMGSALILIGGAQIAQIALGVLMVGIGFAPIFPVVIAMGGQQQPEARGTVTGILAGLAALGGIVVPVAQGWIGGGQSGGMIVPLAASLIMVVALATMRSYDPSGLPSASPHR